MLPVDNAPQMQVARDSYLDNNALGGIKALGRDQDPQALKEVAKKFEAIFVQQML
jgi:flagellar protein FlgJ